MTTESLSPLIPTWEATPQHVQETFLAVIDDIPALYEEFRHRESDPMNMPAFLYEQGKYFIEDAIPEGKSYLGDLDLRESTIGKHTSAYSYTLEFGERASTTPSCTIDVHPEELSMNLFLPNSRLAIMLYENEMILMLDNDLWHITLFFDINEDRSIIGTDWRFVQREFEWHADSLPSAL